MRGTRILIIDGDPTMLRLLAFVFEQVDAQVYTAANGPEGLRQFYAVQPDLVFIDTLLPIVDGEQICRRIREISEVPIILLVARSHDEEVVRGLECGADASVTKPFSPQVLLARTRAVLRRSEPCPEAPPAPIYDDGYLSVDLEGHRVVLLGTLVQLSVTEHRLLAYLLQNAGRVCTTQAILENVWGEGSQDRVHYVHVYMSQLRRKLEPDPQHPRYFHNERGRGYRFQKCAHGPHGANAEADQVARRAA